MIAAGLVMLISVAGAVVAVSVKNIVHAIFGLAVSLGGVALAFLLLGSPFLAAMQVLIYIGGITIAMVFAVMLSSTGRHEPGENTSKRVLAGVASLVFFVAMVAMLLGTDFETIQGAAAAGEGSPEAWSVRAIGRALLNEFNVAFESLSVVLLVAIVGAITIASRPGEGQDAAIDGEDES